MAGAVAVYAVREKCHFFSLYPQIDLQANKRALNQSAQLLLFFITSLGQIHILVAVNAFLKRMKSDWGKNREEPREIIM